MIRLILSVLVAAMAYFALEFLRPAQSLSRFIIFQLGLPHFAFLAVYPLFIALAYFIERFFMRAKTKRSLSAALYASVLWSSIGLAEIVWIGGIGQLCVFVGVPLSLLTWVWLEEVVSKSDDKRKTIADTIYWILLLTLGIPLVVAAIILVLFLIVAGGGQPSYNILLIIFRRR